MNKGYLPLNSDQPDEQQEAELAPLQSSDAESLFDDELDPVPGDVSDDDLTPPSNKKVLPDPVPGDVSVWKATVNLLNYTEGVGFLALPYALKEGGVGALVAFIIIPIILWYMGKILIECLYDEDDQGRKIRARSGYKDLGDVFVPKYGGYILSGVFNFELFLLSVSYLVLFGSVMHHALPSVPITVLMWICIAGGLVLPTTFLKSLSQIAWLSVFSMLTLVAVVVAVVWHGAEHANEWDLETILFWDTEGVVKSLSIILYGYSAFLGIPTVEESMTDKTKFNRVLSFTYLVSLLLKLSFSVCAFLSFGVNTNEVILNNLPPGPVHIIASSIFAFSCIFSYALVLFPLFESCQNSLTKCIQNDKIPSFLTDTVVRVTMVLSTVLVGILVPNFFIIVSFLGSITCAFLTYIFPFVSHLKLKYKQLKLHEVCVDGFLVFFGLIVMIVGVGVSFKSLIEFYNQ